MVDGKMSCHCHDRLLLDYYLMIRCESVHRTEQR